MKANQNIREIKEDKAAYTKVVGGLVALLLTIIVGVLVFKEWSTRTWFSSFLNSGKSTIV